MQGFILKYWSKGFSPWHPNFQVIPQKTEAERQQHFWLRLMGLMLFCSLLVVGVLRFEALKIERSLKSLRLECAKLEPSFKKILKTSANFNEASAFMDAVHTFTAPSQDWLNVIEAVCLSKPDALFFTQVSLKWTIPQKDNKKKTTPPAYWALTIKGQAEGESAQALQMLEHYQDDFNELPIFKGRLQFMEMSQLTRPQESKNINFEFIVHFQPLAL
jgi:hypothetical protein